MNNPLPLESIFFAALERQSPGGRRAYLDDVCAGDTELRDRVERMLAAQSDAGNFLELPAVEIDAPLNHERLISERPGTVIGPYKLLQQIGEGGFGVVFVAEQERPVRRRVALKVIKPGMDTREVIARFEAERQALAMMDHPNIAKVFDAGTTENGRPYFVMELVEGVPITEYCDKCNLTTGERLELFVAVCLAVQHAHQKGVIHRDIKPTNVLVAIQDGKPSPKIIDFGVAKAISQQLTERTLATAFAQIVGTPLYMSPEQAELSPLGVDTRCDIYSLGVLLYELLTGETPFDKDRLHAASYDELRRIIRDEEPPRPSTRISTLAANLATTVAEHRRTDARKLRQSIHGDLDWIVMKCLEKDRNRRYDSAGSLARDVERYLHDEPVLACPPSIPYRLKKFIRRNKIAAAFVIILLAGVAALTVSNFQTRRNERRAVTEGAKAIATSNLLLSMLDSASPEQAKGSTYTVRELVDTFSAGLGDQLKDQPEVEAAIRSTIGNTYRRLELYPQAQVHLEAALELRRKVYGHDHEKVAESQVDLAWNFLGQRKYPQSEKLLREAIKFYETHPGDPLPMIRALWRLECLLTADNRFENSAAVAQRALDLAAKYPDMECPEVASVLHSLAQVRIRQKNYPEAEQLARRSIKLHRRVRAPDHPETAFAVQKLGVALHSQGKSAEAVPYLREALDIFQKHYRSDNTAYANCLEQLQDALRATNDKSALKSLEIEQAKRTTRSDTPDNHVRQADLLLKGGKPTDDQKQEARRLIEWAIDGYAKVAVEAPDDLNRRAAALTGLARVAGVCAKAKGLDNLVDDLNRRLEVEVPNLLSAFPESADCRWQIAMIYRNWAYQLLPHSAYLSTVENSFRKSIASLEQLSSTNPKRDGLWLLLADTWICVGDTRRRLSRADADAAIQQAVEIVDQHRAEIVADESPANLFSTSIIYVFVSDHLARHGRKDEAAEYVRDAARASQSLKDPTILSDALFGEAFARVRLGDEAGYREACASFPPLSEDNANDEHRVRQLWSWCLGPHPGKDFSVQLREAEEFVKENPLDAPYCDSLTLGGLYFRAGMYDRAAKCLNDSIATFPDDPPFGYGDKVFPQLFLAMNRWQQGQHGEARQLLTSIQPDIDKWIASPNCPWFGRAQIEALRREAEEMIGTEKTNEAVENKNGTSDEPKQ